MIEAIREIGEYSLKQDHINCDDPQGLIEIFCEDIQGGSSKPPRVLSIVIEKKDQEYSFVRVSEEGYKREYNSRYLYRFGSSRGANLTPTSKVTEIEKTFPLKIENWFNQDFSKVPYSLGESEIRQINAIKICIVSNKNDILPQINNFLQDIRAKKDAALITLVIVENDKRQYLGDINLFRTIFIKKSRASLYQKYNTEALGKNQICSVCRNKKSEVYGFVSTYNFYTVDKPGMVSGGFNQSQAWKNYPVCINCALELERGKKYLEKHSNFHFHSFDYFVIPKPILGEHQEIFETLKIFQEEGNQIKLNENYRSLMSDTKEEILKYLSDKENSFLCNILIYLENNNEFKIERYIEDIFPSRLKELFNAKDVIDSQKILRALQVPVYKDNKKVGDRQFEFTFDSIYHFFGKEKDSDARTYFLDIIHRIFTGKSISYQFILAGITRKIRKTFAQDYPTKESALRGLALLAYLNELHLLGSKEEGNKMIEQMKSIDVDKISETYKRSDGIFQEFPAFFDTNAKRAIFLEGVLCQRLLNIQYRERKATPFRIKLQGLKLDQRRIQALLPEMQNKLEEYKANYYRDLERLISSFMVAAGNDWNLSKDEIAFYFVLGMNLVDQFSFEKQEEGVN